MPALEGMGMLYHKQKCFVVALAFTFGLFGNGAGADDQQATNADEELLKEHGLRTSAQELLAQLKNWSGNDDELLGLDNLTRNLDSDSFRDRQMASEELLRIGPAAAPSLIQVINTSGLEAARRSQAILDTIGRHWKPEHRMAAVRRLVALRPMGAGEALLKLLPWTGDEELAEEIFFGLYQLAKADVRTLQGLEAAVNDRLPARRALAGCLLGRLGGATQKTAAQQLLKDPSAIVRLRAAQGLLAGKDAAGVPALIALLGQTDANISWQAEELLRWSAQGDAPHEVVGAASPAERERCETAWQAWWKHRKQTLDWPAIVADPRRPGLVLVHYPITDVPHKIIADEIGPLFVGHFAIYGCDGTVRWKLVATGAGSIQLLAQNRVLLTENGSVDTGPDGKLPVRRMRALECDLAGKPLWRVSEAFSMAYCRRLPNGSTFLALGFDGAMEYTLMHQSVPGINFTRTITASAHK